MSHELSHYNRISGTLHGICSNSVCDSKLRKNQYYYVFVENGFYLMNISIFQRLVDGDPLPESDSKTNKQRTFIDVDL